MSNKTKPQIEKNAPRVDQSRRRLTKAGMVVGPVLLSLSSKPVWAIECDVSGMLSGNLSNNFDQVCPKPGLSASYWGTHTDNWADYLPEAIFDSTFGVNVFGTDTTLFSVINLLVEPTLISCIGSPTDQNTLANNVKSLSREFIAALLNVAVLPEYSLRTGRSDASIKTDYIDKINAVTGGGNCNLLATANADLQILADEWRLDNNGEL